MKSSPLPSDALLPVPLRSPWEPLLELTRTIPIAKRWAREAAWILGRSLFPFVTLTLLFGTLLWGPWVTLLLAVVWWKVVTRIA